MGGHIASEGAARAQQELVVNEEGCCGGTPHPPQQHPAALSLVPSLWRLSSHAMLQAPASPGEIPGSPPSQASPKAAPKASPKGSPAVGAASPGGTPERPAGGGLAYGDLGASSEGIRDSNRGQVTMVSRVRPPTWPWGKQCYGPEGGRA